jgi:endonuclease YncB( thermonuclease family)
MRVLKLLFIIFSFTTLLFAVEFKKVEIIKIVDGDTLIVKDLQTNSTLRIRVYGIDTPEKYKSVKLYKDIEKCHLNNATEEIKLGKLASEHAKQIIYEYEKLSHTNQVWLKIYGKGYYGRIIAKVLLTPYKNIAEKELLIDDFGSRMILDGYACQYKYNKDLIYKNEQNFAQFFKLGLWKINYKLMNCLCNY